MIAVILARLLCTEAEVESLHASSPSYLTHEQAVSHCGAAHLAAIVTGEAPEVLLAIAWHESRYTVDAVTREPGNRVSCGVMTPVPHAAPCSPVELSLLGGYLIGAAHLAVWRRLARTTLATLDAYAGGGTLARTCAPVDARSAVHACAFALVTLARAQRISARHS